MRSPVLIVTTVVLCLSCSDAAVRSPTAPSETIATEGTVPDARQSGHPIRRRAARARSSPSALLGSWGGEHIQLDLQIGGGRVELDCAHGTIDESIVVGGEGTFAVRGTLTLERGGPVTDTDVENTRPARYRGKVSEERIALTITVDGGDVAESFTLVRNRLPRITKCL
ncbi:MAG: hypothetical protein ACXW3E_02260 [Thermoanaerobaculia bacterium]